MEFPMSDIFSNSTDTAAFQGTKDGQGAADRDCPYEFNQLPRAHAPAPFSVREYARLLLLRGRVREGVFAMDDVEEARRPLRWPPPVTRSTNPWCRCSVCRLHATPVAVLLGRTLLCLRCAQNGKPVDLTEAILYTAVGTY
jgi:hypothetical protein